MQDLDFTAWGLGTGVSVHGQLRVRGAVGDARELWPQATQTMDVLAAYVDVDRPRYQARLGRQWIASGLGMFNFDGASLALRPWTALSIRGYGGASLIEGLNRPLSDAAHLPVEDLPPLQRAYLVGGVVDLRPSPRGGLAVQYQREIGADRAALYSERAAANGELQFWRATASGQLSYNAASNVWNDAAAQLTVLLRARLDAQLEARSYTPYFDLWTIWGAFSPVGYQEVRGSLLWSDADARLSASVDGGRRRYENTQTGVQTLLLRTDGWRLGGNASLRLGGAWVAQGSYHIDVGFGASRSDGDAALSWQPSERVSLRAHGLAVENVYEFQVGTGRMIGGGLEGSVRLTSDVLLAGDALVFRHTAQDQPQLASWNQRRASLRLVWTLGMEPGRPADRVAGGAQ